MKLDRDLQREILQKLADAYPNPPREAFDQIEVMADEDTLVGNMLYLEQHGLIVRPVASYGLADWVRISIGTQPEIDRLLEVAGAGQPARG